MDRSTPENCPYSRPLPEVNGKFHAFQLFDKQEEAKVKESQSVGQFKQNINPYGTKGKSIVKTLDKVKHTQETIFCHSQRSHTEHYKYSKVLY